MGLVFRLRQDMEIATEEGTPGDLGRALSPATASRPSVRSRSMDPEEVLAVLHGWLGMDVEVSTHGADGAYPVLALEVRGRPRRGEPLGTGLDQADSLMFELGDDLDRQIGSFVLSTHGFRGGGWLDDEEEVLEMRSGVVKFLIALPEESDNA
jgi:hypothetical protein